MAARRKPAEPRRDLDVQFEVTVVDGEAGRRLAVLQAEAIIDVLTWMRDRAGADLDATPSQTDARA